MFVTHHRRRDEKLLNRDNVGARNASTVNPEYPRERTGRVGVSKGPGVRANASSSALPPGPWSNLWSWMCEPMRDTDGLMVVEESIEDVRRPRGKRERDGTMRATDGVRTGRKPVSGSHGTGDDRPGGRNVYLAYGFVPSTSSSSSSSSLLLASLFSLSSTSDRVCAA